MAEHKLLLPSMGEGVMEATIIGWLFKEGDFVNEDDSVVEIATDKVDSDVPTPVSGKIIKESPAFSASFICSVIACGLSLWRGISKALKTF